jgi:tRNA pseudouridine32 synthase / 23S rRNA pseudouridine746 synthase
MPCPPRSDAPPLALPVLFADDWLVVVDKPAGLLSVPGRGADKADCAVSRVQTRYPDALTVHRLDMGTSGLLVLARGEQAQRALSHAFEARQVHKHYVALVAGQVDGEAGQIDLPLMADWPNRPRQKVDAAQGKPSLTHWQVLARDPLANSTRLLLTPVTGRTHQLRVHLRAIGHPILGDALYAPPQVLAAAARLMLHASALALVHPHTGEALQLQAPPPF